MKPEKIYFWGFKIENSKWFRFIQSNRQILVLMWGLRRSDISICIIIISLVISVSSRIEWVYVEFIKLFYLFSFLLISICFLCTYVRTFFVCDCLLVTDTSWIK